MRFFRIGLAALAAATITAVPAAAQHSVHVDGDDITIRGCVTPADGELRMPFETLIWSRSGILTAGGAAADAAVHAGHDLASRVLYWIDSDELKKHVGQMVEVRGELEELKKGELEIERDGDFTEIRLELDGDEDTIRVPTSWLSRSSVARAATGGDDDVEIDIATRKVDIDDVKVVGRCPVR
jgi:hypothetical protein